MNFTDFLAFDSAAQAIFPDGSAGHRHCRDFLCRLAETARHPGLFSEAAKDSRKGVAFKSRSLDDLETSVFAGRLAQRLGQQSSTGKPYGDFIRRSVLTQGEVLGDMNWEQWAVTKAALELGGVDPAILDDPNTSPAQRFAAIDRVNWQNVTVPNVKAKLGPSFRVPDDWKRAFGIERLKRIKTAVEQGQPVANPQEQRLLGIWRTLETQLRGEDGEPNQILAAGPKADVGRSRLPMSLADRRRLYSALTGQKNENADVVQGPLQLSAQSAYDLLTGKYGVEIITDDEAKDLYLNRVLADLRNNNAFVPSSAQGSEPDRKRWRDSAARSWGGYLPASRFYDPSHEPGAAQRIAGMTTRGHKTRLNPSGRRVPYDYNEPEEFQWPDDAEDMPGIKYTIDAPSSEVRDEQINAFYRSRSPESAEVVRLELEKPARDAVGWLRKQGWIDDPSKIDDFVQDVVMGMLNRTGACKDWRNNLGFRRATAMMLARRFASQGWPSQAKEKSGRLHGDDDQSDFVQTATSNRSGGEDQYSRMQAGAARARAAIQQAIARVLDIDTAAMGGDEEAFVDAIDSLSDPSQAVRAGLHAHSQCPKVLGDGSDCQARPAQLPRNREKRRAGWCNQRHLRLAQSFSPTTAAANRVSRNGREDETADLVRFVAR